MSLEDQITELTTAINKLTAAVEASTKAAPPSTDGVVDLQEKTGGAVKKKATRKKTTAKKTSTADKNEPEVTLTEISEYMVECDLGRPTVLSILAEFGVKKASDLKEEQRSDFLDALKAAATGNEDDLAA